MKDIDETKAPLMEHLIELRRRLLWCLAALAVAFFVCLYFARDIFAVLVHPLLNAGQGKLIYTDIFEAFFAEVKVALFAAAMITFPVIATQLWKFVAPGLYVKEKKAFLPFLVMTPFFFAAGACFAYFVAMPWALKFLLGFAAPGRSTTWPGPSPDADHAAWGGARAQAGGHPTEVIDRQYFHSIYFHEPGGVLFEIATPSPGSRWTRSPTGSGEELRLPPQYEPYRERIEERLTPLGARSDPPRWRPPPPRGRPMSETGDDRLDRGRELAELHLGEGVVERWRAVSPDLEELTSAFGFGDLWSRPGLGRRDRSIVAMAVTATLRPGPQLGWHVRGALGAGVTPDEVREVLIAVVGPGRVPGRVDRAGGGRADPGRARGAPARAAGE